MTHNVVIIDHNIMISVGVAQECVDQFVHSNCFSCRSAMMFRDDCKLRWRLLMCESYYFQPVTLKIFKFLTN